MISVIEELLKYYEDDDHTKLIEFAQHIHPSELMSTSCYNGNLGMVKWLEKSGIAFSHDNARNAILGACDTKRRIKDRQRYREVLQYYNSLHPYTWDVDTDKEFWGLK